TDRLRLSVTKARERLCWIGSLWLEVWPQKIVLGHVFVLGAHVSGADPLGKFRIIVRTNSTYSHNSYDVYTRHGSHKSDSCHTPLPANLQRKLAIETGFTQKNFWLDWVQNAAEEVSVNTSFVLHMTENPKTPACRELERYYPLAPKDAVPPIFTAVKNNYTCVTKANITGTNVGTISPDWCNNTHNLTIWANATRLTYARSDVFWYCGGNRLLNILPPDWFGTCTMISLIVPVTVVEAAVSDIESGSGHPFKGHRLKRDALFDPARLSPTYIDAIGISCGVPNEYKLVDQEAAGFESALFCWVTINKNVDRINYVHFNVQRLTNFTRDLALGFQEQLAATSIIAVSWQNRQALDWILAEKGGVCALIGEYCCTYIPGHTAPEGAFTEAMRKVRDLKAEVMDNAVNTTSGWKQGLVRSMVIVFIGVVAMGFVLCCCLPVMRSVILSAVERKTADGNDGAGSEAEADWTNGVAGDRRRRRRRALPGGDRLKRQEDELTEGPWMTSHLQIFTLLISQLHIVIFTYLLFNHLC
uniref:Uncharacterized protein n=1 Tax=Monopterus albus TaxID=43700 RepID=A0A3Q3JTQ2_MONAL